MCTRAVLAEDKRPVMTDPCSLEIAGSTVSNFIADAINQSRWLATCIDILVRASHDVRMFGAMEMQLSLVGIPTVGAAVGIL